MMCDAGHREHGVGTLDEKEPYHITAGCGHEVCAGEDEYASLDDDYAPTLCPDCIEDVLSKLSTGQKAYLLRYGGVPVRDYS